MIRRIIHIDENKCVGCGLCANACHEGAIDIVNGKARLVRENFCDGFGDCLPECPTGAISFEEREAPAYDEAAVEQSRKDGTNKSKKKAEKAADNALSVSELRNWPVEIKLAPLKAPYFDGADLLVAADCTAYAYAAFHRDFIRGKVTLVGCSKLDAVDYSEKLTEIFSRNDIESITVTRMEVPCCGGLERAVRTAIDQSGKNIPLRVVTISIEGDILNDVCC